MEFFDYFRSLLSIEVFIQGFVFTLCLSLGLFMILSDQRDYFAGTKNFKEYRDKLRLLVQSYFRRITLSGLLATPFRDGKEESSLRFVVLVNSLALAIIIFIATLVSGIIIHSISDKWMEERPSFHLGLKILWHDGDVLKVEQDLNVKTDHAVRLNVFQNIMGDISKHSIRNHESGKLIKELYYMGKHSMLKNETWREYIISTQNIVDITESFSFSFFILFCLCYINFFINIFRDVFDSNKNNSIAIFLPALVFVLLFATTQIIQDPGYWLTAVVVLALPCIIQILVSYFESRVRIELNNFYSLTSVILIYLSGIAYVVSSVAWLQNSEEVCSKVFGVYRYENVMLRSLTETRTKLLFENDKSD